MSPELTGVLGVVVLVALIMLKAPVGLSLLLVGFTGVWFLNGSKVALIQLGMSTFNFAGSYTLSVVALFILMGLFLTYSGLSKDLYTAADNWVGHVRGGLGMATIGASAIFASISGSAMSTTATMAKVSLPEMKRYNYNPGMAAATIAAGGTLGILIPPSVALIIYGVLTMEPISTLLIAGIVPGILLTFVFMLTLYIQIKRNPDLAPLNAEPVAFKEKISSIVKIWPFVLIFILSIGGIYFGFFTPNEAGAVGAFGALAFTVLTRRLNWKKFIGAVDESVRLTAMIFIVLIGANLFSNFLAVSRLPNSLSSFVTGLEMSPYIILAVILVIYFILGLFMESIAIQVLTLPIVYPIIIGLGFDGIWFAIVFVMILNMALITPPLGVNCYIIHGIDKSIPLERIFASIMPMLIAMIIFTIILIVFPQIIMFLPNLM